MVNRRMNKAPQPEVALACENMPVIQGVKTEVGGRVKAQVPGFDPQFGMITGAVQGYLMVRWDDQANLSYAVDPSMHLEYLGIGN